MNLFNQLYDYRKRSRNQRCFVKFKEKASKKIEWGVVQYKKQDTEPILINANSCKSIF